jgi:hypothetical protein
MRKDSSNIFLCFALIVFIYTAFAFADETVKPPKEILEEIESGIGEVSSECFMAQTLTDKQLDSFELKYNHEISIKNKVLYYKVKHRQYTSGWELSGDPLDVFDFKIHLSDRELEDFILKIPFKELVKISKNKYEQVIRKPHSRQPLGRIDLSIKYEVKSIDISLHDVKFPVLLREFCGNDIREYCKTIVAKRMKTNHYIKTYLKEIKVKQPELSPDKFKMKNHPVQD